jgi:kumamolisin
VLSLSWGGADWAYSDSLVASFESVFQTAVVKGITICVATGDYGSQAVNGDLAPLTVQYPGSSPYVLACGGTSLLLNSDNSISSEVTWNTNDNGTGGGVSGVAPSQSVINTGFPPSGGVPQYTAKHFAVPSWQSGITSQTWQVTPGTKIALTGRGVPDVCGNAYQLSGYYFWYGPDPRPFYAPEVGGTSAVSPLWAGYIARLNALTGRRQGFVNAKLYANPGLLNDINDGGNNACTNLAVNGYIGYYAGAGWDACTGLGSPNGTATYKSLKVGSTFPRSNYGFRPTKGQAYPRLAAKVQRNA